MIKVRRNMAISIEPSVGEVASGYCHPANVAKEHCPHEAKIEPKTDVLDKIRVEIEKLPTNTRTNWDGCCPDIDYPEIEYVDVTKKKLLGIIDKYKAESEDKE